MNSRHGMRLMGVRKSTLEDMIGLLHTLGLLVKKKFTAPIVQESGWALNTVIAKKNSLLLLEN
jgi:hypothetical protein